ncbi:unnamed protein product [Cuscuta campestris]|uniref:Reverse transcriptase domain-containing protein n=1 Tax=Cuscuta campestris TaxID=132261 RepID=A0A484N5H4_9ASTE|nr:unnamed protein product [Cuscuta campestris]
MVVWLCARCCAFTGAVVIVMTFLIVLASLCCRRAAQSAKKAKKKLPRSSRKKRSGDDVTETHSLNTDIAMELPEKEKAPTTSSTSETSPPLAEDVPDTRAQVGITSAQETPQVFDKMPEPEMVAAKPVTFGDLFKGNRDTDQGMILKQYDVGEGVLHIPDSIIKPVEELWGFCLVGCFTGRFPGLKAVDAIVKRWNVPCRIIPHCKGWVILKFENDSDRLDVLGRERDKAYGKEFRLKIPSHGFMFDFAEFTTLSVWVQLHNVPLQLWSEEGIGMLASKVGKPLRTDLVTKQQGKGGFCRVLVEVDISKQPMTHFEVACMGKTYTQTVVFEEDPKYCFHCKTWNHGPFYCKALELVRKKELAGLEATNKVGMDKPKEHKEPPGKAGARDCVPTGKNPHVEPKGGLIPSSSNNKEKAKEPTPKAWLLTTWLERVLIYKRRRAMRDSNERVNCMSQGAYYMTDLQGFKSFNCLEDVPSTGNFFTWHKGNKLAKLDRVLANQSWGDIGLAPTCEFLDFNFLSDHCPTLFQCGAPPGNRFRPFRFFNMWLKHEGFNGLISQSWEAGVVGSKQFSLCSKLKRLKPPLKALNRQAFGHISRRAMEAKEEYGLVMKQLVLDPNNQTLLDDADIKRKRANFLLDAELAFYQQNAKCDFLMNSDRCTSYFHSIVKKNRRKNTVGFLVREDGSKTTSKDEVANIFVDFFTTLFGTTSPVEPIELEILTTGTRVPSSAQSSLLASVTPEEVREAVFDIGNDKAPGPDGYTAAFFKDQWAVVGRDIYEAVLEFFTSGKLLRQINHAMIVLIPKSSHNPTIKDFRPIACLNVLYKVITKILAKRMAPLLPDLIDPAQGAFVPGRSLVDNFLLAQHLIRDYAIKRSTPSCLIKLDITKAYDTVSWSFLQDVMHGVGLDKGIPWHLPFSSFVLSTSLGYSTKGLKKVASTITGCAALGITHLAFADDLMLFSRGDVHSVQVLMDALDHFSRVSGLTLNPTKSNIFLAGKYRDVSQNILDPASFPHGQLPVRYLGLPLASQRISESDFAPLFKTVDGFLSKWSTLKLSYAGRLELIRAVVQGVQSFWLQAFPVQKYVLDRITSMCRGFLWGSKFSKVAWVDICKPRVEGGLGLKDANTWNNALLCKLLWNLAAKKDTLWVKWVHNVYIQGENLWQWQPKKRHSVFFKRLAYVRELLVQKLGDHYPSMEEAMKPFCLAGNLIPRKVYDLFRVKANPKPWMAFIWQSYIPLSVPLRCGWHLGGGCPPKQTWNSSVYLWTALFVDMGWKMWTTCSLAASSLKKFGIISRLG